MWRARPSGGGGAGTAAGAGGRPQCQRCLKFGKWTFECCKDASSRVYVSRPSRTAQLKNPKVRQRFADAADQPPDLRKEEKERRAAIIGKVKGPRAKRHRRSIDRSDRAGDERADRARARRSRARTRARCSRRRRRRRRRQVRAGGARADGDRRAGAVCGGVPSPPPLRSKVVRR
ncbi:uncharacterized protein MICPUCDRAFT_59925 [Micromonas pusilla CCMP1545]|uniref:Predicted protein n=1 Tax=Micromonas pusilla (strain CCMP1545) TaxID=564608 RepID=C1MYJ9_MICPC|nr:uncharacterized protein MICPUCDRAFT_59925 [Micromonas pusilla CCMP1545]EEH55057.1 predicted protein [Micromonas pusilla CCMP1545]|eukprot:XP_003060288.1 predicted protein [Micromonas pusilla CCMP1545]